MAASHNVEFEAAKFLQKLIQESTDEPARLATKLCVILQHMKASGKENSMPYQVISRAMETVINQHGLDIEALTSLRLPSSSGPQGESATTHAAGSSQTLPVTDSKSGMMENDSSRTDGFGSCCPSAAPNSLGHDLFQGPVSQRSGRSFDHESPSSIDTKSTNSHSQDRRETASWEQHSAQKNPNRASVKRKKSDSSAMEPPDDSIQKPDSYNTVPDSKKERLTSKVEMPEKFPGVSESWKHGFKSATNFPETSVPGHLLSPNQANVSMTSFNSASCSGAAGIHMGADRLLQTANLSGVGEVGTLRSPVSKDKGRAPSTTNMPFKEHHLKQLRAQCLVFLAFRNGLAPKRLHLEIALGNILVQEGTTGSVDGAQKELMSDKGKRPSTLESSCTAEASLPRVNPAHVKNERAVIGTAAAGCVPEVDAILNETNSVKTAGAEMGVLDDSSHIDVEKRVPLGRGTFEAETQSQEISNTSGLLTTGLELDRLSMISPAVRSHDASLQPGGTNQGDYVLGTNKPLKPDMTRWTGVAQNNFSRSALPANIPQELGNRKDVSSIVSQHESDSHLSTSWKAIQGTEGNNGAVDKTMSITDGSKIVPVFDSGYIHRSPSPLGSEPEEEDKSVSVGLAPSSKQTLSEKWIMAHQKRKVVNEQKWVHRLQKADQRIACRFSELKETVSSSEDISAKTRSVIELKKLQLLELQRRLRRNIMNDFFKPVQSEMDQLKSIKKHRIGRRLKHVEKYEQKMKEERQKRIRERQKEFFSEIEVHKERLEDVFKFKRERCKGFIRYVKEFHKRKERIHREKIDRIQREKINLLKINDVEGYLRMVQDAKSDRVKQLLKETEKYLQKLGSKLQEAKTSAREVDIDENRIATFDESSENAAETEDEKDQAKHYKESNEKYYLIAHSIKESITEQPAGIQGGKLREYQMNGLRWLVSLYNNHLNGILADEMGLGKTVQVISLLCYLMEAKNDRGPFLVVVPSSVLPGWEREMSFWAPGINKIVYAGPPEERRRLFKDCIVHQKFNVLLTTYEYLMNKHDRPKLSKIHWHYVIIDEGHRIKNASCKLNADLKHYQSSHRLLLTGTPLQNSLEELWALLNFLLPNIFNSSEDFSQWFNKPFEGNGDNSPDEALLSEEENLLIINRLHQVLRPFVLRRLKHKVENELPEKIERLVRCEASAYQKLLMMRVEENLGSLGMSKGRAIHNTVMELRNICNHPYLSQLHVEEVDSLIPKHFLPPIIRLCGKLEMLDRLLPKLKETNHRVLFFSTMTRLLDIMEDYLVWKQYRYLRLDGHTSGQDRGALIEKFNQPDSPFFIFLLSIRAGGVGVNLQAADTVIIFDTDWNPQVDLQAQARAHRIGQKKDVLVLRLETVKSVEEQVRAAAEHKLGVANQSITAGFFDNNTSAEDRREYLESLLRESKKEEAAPVLDDDSLNDILARSEPEIAVFEAIDKKRREEEMATWKTLVLEHGGEVSDALPPLPSRLVTEDDLKAFYEAMKMHEAASDGATTSSGIKRKGGYIGGFDSQQYGRGKRAREVRSYEEQWSEEEFEKMCQSEYPETIISKDEKVNVPQPSESRQIDAKVEIPLQSLQPPPPPLESLSLVRKEVTPPVKRGRGRPRRIPTDAPPVGVSFTRNTIGISEPESQLQKVIVSTVTDQISLDCVSNSAVTKDASGGSHGDDAISVTSNAVRPALPGAQSTQGSTSVAPQPKRQGRKGKISQNDIPGEPGTETIRRRGRKPSCALPPVPTGSLAQDQVPGEQLKQPSSDTSVSMNTISKVTSDNSFDDGSRGMHPKFSEGSDILNLKDSKGVELATKNSSFDMSLKATTSPTHEETCKIDALSHSLNTNVQKHMGMLPGTVVENPKLYEQSVKHALSDSSAVNSAPREPLDVNKVDVVSQGQVLSISKSSAGSTAVSIGEGTPSVLKAELHRDNPQPTASSSEAQPSSTTLRTGRRQSQKPQNAAEPVRRRGRKRGLSASADSTPPAAQDQNLQEPLKTANMGAVTVPVTLVSGSGFVPGSAAVTGVSGSVHHGSMGFVPIDPNSLQSSPVLSADAAIHSDPRKTPVDFQTQGQAQRDMCTETTPRRRGRKKSTVSPAGLDHSVGQYSFARQPDVKDGDIAVRKVISTRNRQVNISQPQSSQEDFRAVSTFASLASKDSVAGVSYMSPDVVPSPCTEQSASVKADGIGNPLETKHTSTVEEIKQFVCPADFPPISSKGRTNVIVLALDATSLDVDPIGMGDRNMHEKIEFSKLQIESTPSASILKPELSRLDFTPATGMKVAKLDDELSAPPGFETSRPCVFNAAVIRSGEHNDCGISSSPNAKVGSVVLALKSASQTVVPGIGCQFFCEKEECAEVHSFKESGRGTVIPPLPESCAAVLEDATVKVMSCQPEEDMLVPPGFDIPQKRLSESDAANTQASDDYQASDVLAESDVNVRVEEDCQGPSNTEQNLADTFTTSVVGPCNAAATTLESKEQEESHEPVNTEQTPVVASTASIAVPFNAAFSSLESKEQEKSHGPDSGDIGNDTSDAPVAVAVVDSDTTATLTLQSKEKGDNLGPYNEAASALESKEQEELHWPDLGSFRHDASDALLAVGVVDSDIAATLTLELKEKGEHLGPGNTEQNVVDASTASVDGNFNATASVLESKEREESLGPDSGDIGDDTSDAPLAESVVDSDTAVALTLELNKKDLGRGNTEKNVVASLHNAATSALELEEHEESHGSGSGDMGHDTSNARLAVCVVDADISTTLTSESKKDGESLGPYSASASALESREEEETLGPENGDSTHDTSDAPLAASVVDSDTATALTLELNEKAPVHGDFGHDTSDASLAVGVVDSDTVATLTLKMSEKGEHLGPGNTEQNVVDASTASVDAPCSATASALESKEQEESHGPDSGDIGHETSDSPLGVCVVDSDSAVTLTLMLNEKDHLGPSNAVQHGLDASTTSVAGPCNAAASALESKEQEESHGPDDGIADLGARDFPTDSMVLNHDLAEASALGPEENQEACDGPGDAEYNVIDDSSVSVAGPYNAAVSALASREQEKSHGPADCSADLGAHDVMATSMVLSSDSAKVSALALKVEEEAPGLDDCNVRRDAAGSPSSVMAGNDTTAAFNPEPQEGELIHGPGSDLTENDAVSVSAMELKGEEKTHGPDDCKTEDDAGDSHTTSHVGSDTVVETISESKGKND